MAYKQIRTSDINGAFLCSLSLSFPAPGVLWFRGRDAEESAPVSVASMREK